jgi:anti-sigma B factor antagonist
LRALVAAHSDLDIKRLAHEFARPEWGAVDLDADRLHAELRRLDLHTPERRAAFARDTAIPVAVPAASPASEAPTAAVDTGALRVHRREVAAGTAVLAFSGTVDSSSCAALEPFLQHVAATHPRLAIDLGAAAYISSRGWGLLAALQSQVASAGGAVVVCGMGQALADVHRMLGFEQVLAAYDAIEPALAALATSRDATPEPAIRAATPVPRPIASGTGLRLEIARPANDVAVVAVHGIIDTLHAYELERTLSEAVGNGVRWVIVDLSAVEFVSSAGWGSFTAHLPALRQRQGGVRLFGMHREVARIHALLHLESVLPAFDVLAAALPEPVPAAAVADTAVEVIPAADLDRERDAALRSLGWDAYVARFEARGSWEAA